MNQPETLRDELRAARRNLPAPYRAAAAAKVCQSMSELESFQSAASVAGFLAFDGEADPLGLMLRAGKSQKRVYVPMMVGKKQPLMFAPWSPEMPFKKNSSGIHEPDLPQPQWVTAEQIDFVITPLVAFDDRGHRIGMGAGYYDRSFAFLRNVARADRTTRLFGFAFELQRVKAIKPQDWDVTLDGVITEKDSYLDAR